MKILEEVRWSSGDYRGIRCKVCGGLRSAEAGRRAGDLDNVAGFPHREGCEAAEMVRFIEQLLARVEAAQARK